MIKTLKKYTAESKLKPEFLPALAQDLGFEKKMTGKRGFKAVVDEIIKPVIHTWTAKEFKINMPLVATLVNTHIEKYNTKKQLFSDMRKIIEKHGVKDPRYKSLQTIFDLGEEGTVEKKKGAERVKQANLNQVVLSDQTVQNLIRKTAYKQHLTFYDKLVVLQIVSGCRSIEILSSNVSNFELDEKKPDYIFQTGVAKMRKGKKKDDDGDEDLDYDAKRVVNKPILIITPTEFLGMLAEIRTKIGDVTSVSNATLTNRYNGKINEHVRKLFVEHGVPVSDKLKSSHALRKLYGAYSYSHNAPRGVSLVAWLSRVLGHGEEGLSASANNYSVVSVETASILTEKQAGAVNSALDKGVMNQDQIKELKNELKEIKNEIQKPKKEIVKVVKTKADYKQLSSTDDKYKVIEELIAQGVTSYRQMQSHGVSTYLYSKFKKEKGSSKKK